MSPQRPRLQFLGKHAQACVSDTKATTTDRTPMSQDPNAVVALQAPDPETLALLLHGVSAYQAWHQEGSTKRRHKKREDPSILHL